MASSPQPSSGTGFSSGRAIDKLRAAARLEPVKKSITLSDGSLFEMYCTPLVSAERDIARKNVDATKDTSGDAFGLQLIVLKAKDEHGQPLFANGDIPELRREVRQEDLNKVILAVMGEDDDSIVVDQKK
jgi:hypothetical protein